MEILKIKRALLSVSDTAHLIKLATALNKHEVELIASGGTRKHLEEAGFLVTPIEKVTGNPEAFSGRMKTLSFNILSGLLFKRDDSSDLKESKNLNIEAIDLVVCNFYPFEEVIKKSNKEEELIENIDIGGPSIVRAAAKNYKWVSVLTDPKQYDSFLSDYLQKGGTSLALRKKLSLLAFSKTAEYEVMIVAHLKKKAKAETDLNTLSICSTQVSPLRYGENSHQKAWVCVEPGSEGLASLKPLQGKALSYNNLLDADVAWRTCSDLHELQDSQFSAVAVIIKHLNPCGAAIASTSLEALRLAWASDPISSFGSVIAFNSEVNADVANFFQDKFIEIIIAPSFSKKALEVLSVKKNLRLIKLSSIKKNLKEFTLRSISGGYLFQEEDVLKDKCFKSVTDISFPEEKMSLVKFGIIVAKYVKSNAIVLVSDFLGKGRSVVGVGMGNPNRLVSLQQASKKAKINNISNFSDLVLISDAFFPFCDNIELADKQKLKYIVQPGGSIKDKEIISKTNELKMSMLFTGYRHFRH